jgi:bacillithiol biosynthesis deacetylase BshB1
MSNKLDILIFAAHPDDAELGCGGTISKHVRAGKKVGVIDLTKGELGSRGNAELRLEEARNSSKLLKLSVRENLGLADGFFEVTKENKLKVAEMIRKYQPEVILANAISDRHPDHGRASELVKQATFLSGLVKIDSEFEPWRARNTFFYVQDNYHHVDVIVDISNDFKHKMEAIKAFSSQFYSGNTEGPETPISSPEFIHFLEARAREYGRIIGVEFGEGFISSRSIGINDLTLTY